MNPDAQDLGPSVGTACDVFISGHCGLYSHRN